MSRLEAFLLGALGGGTCLAIVAIVHTVTRRARG